MGLDESPPQKHRLTSLYESFNQRDIPAVLAALAPGVSWPNGWEGGTVHGHHQVRDYWTRQWAEIDPTVVPVAFTTEDDGRVAVTVHQVVRTRQGAIVADEMVEHVYRFIDDLVTDMQIRK
jgi:ketosteroid isomerase-like protein